ncbi:MAG TPA: hypothetical protein VHB02_15235 [Acidimicrobiales bacterium]|nr:hypothetical protein [Acidimicrobiales bacterium]
MLPPPGSNRDAVRDAVPWVDGGGNRGTGTWPWPQDRAAVRPKRPKWVLALLAITLLVGCGSVVATVGIAVVHGIGAGGGCGGG